MRAERGEADGGERDQGEEDDPGKKNPAPGEDGARHGVSGTGGGGSRNRPAKDQRFA
ncbi:hypothetical protein [Sphingobium fuliginis]|uniref:hypothetical protein n=1 Tax=Sphingobium fuliginis (strain ATCC 27551) TaxID=336203 RepID=UPI00190F9158|nr:hypothetical protein [Sphingobium fuliginis]